nr:RagB/SusD family nutrient uptake outer membrane protein [Cytophagales bacterium]
MKNYSFKHIVLLLILGYSFAGCHEFLEEHPETFISPNAYYRNAEDATSAINAVYAILPRFYQGIAYGESVFFTLEMPSDQANSGTGVSVVDQDRLDAYIYDPAIRHLRLWWQYSYQGINAANTVLHHVPAIEMSESVKNRILSEAYYLRAYFYFDLVRLFGAVPLSIEPTLNISNVNVSRDDVSVVYEQIIQDLIMAENNLPSVGSGEVEHGRASKGAASTLLAKVYLTLERWADAANKAEEVVNSGDYQLFDNYSQAFKVENKNGIEHIFSIQFERTIISSNFHAWFLPRYRGIQANTEEFGAILPNMDFYNSYSDGDHRKSANFYTSYPAADGSGIVEFEPHIFKYFDPSVDVVGGSSMNYPKLRYAETLLILAEAENEANGPSAKALTAINQVRNRAKLPNLETMEGYEPTKEYFRNAVLKERSWELAYEGNRYFDMLRTRTSISGPLIGYNSGSGVFKAHNVLFPIPQREIDNNNNLVQNLGY